MSIPKIKTKDLINSLKEYPDLLVKEAANQLESFIKDWHQPELCNEKYNNLVVECNAWEELCEELIEIIEDIPNLEKKVKHRILIEKYYKLKGHYEY
jgi:ribonuclease HIII